MNFRSIIEKISRGIVLKRKLSKKFDSRTIYISPEAGLRYWKPTLSEIDPMLLFISEKFIEKNDIIWDIGANVGLFTFTSIIKSGTGKCLSFEPDIWLCNLLRRSANRNPDLDVQILPLAVSEEIGFVTFNIANRSRATNFISKATGSSQTGGTRTSYIVPTVTLNHVLKFNDPPQFVKIDTEGAELLILNGAFDVLEHKPKILCEVSNETFGPVVDILNNFKYKLYDATKLPEMIELTGNQITDNILALP